LQSSRIGFLPLKTHGLPRRPSIAPGCHCRDHHDGSGALADFALRDFRTCGSAGTVLDADTRGAQWKPAAIYHQHRRPKRSGLAVRKVSGAAGRTDATEIINAWKAGADFVKVFPARRWAEIAISGR